MRSRLALLALGLSLLPLTAFAEDWPGWRGPGGTGLSSDAQAPTEWSEAKNIAWKVKVPGYAWSQPIVLGDKVIVTTAVSDKQTKPLGGAGGGGGGGRPGGGGPPGGGDRPRGTAPGGGRPPGGGQPGGGGRGMGSGGPPPDALYTYEVHCLDRATGKTLWTETAAKQKPGIPTHRTNTYASETPVTDGERLYVYFGMVGLYCYDLSGKKLWEKKIGPYPMMAGWGTGSSPVLVGDLVYLQCDNEKESFIVAFDKKTGDEKWRVAREEKSTWATPFVWKNKDRTELVTNGMKKIVSYDPATGKVLWEIGGNTGRCSATPVGDENMLYVGTGGGPQGLGPLYAVKAGASGDITLKEGETSNAGLAWKINKGGPPMSSPLLWQGRLYLPQQGGGALTCLDAATGKELWKQRIPGASSFTSSPWASGGKVYCLDDSGATHVLDGGPEFKVLSKNTLGEPCWSSPALADGAIFLRTMDHLWCIKTKG